MTDMADTTRVRREEGEKEMGTISQARWLARQEIKRTWLSYVATGAFFLFGSLFALIFFRQFLGGEAPGGTANDVYIIFSSNVFFLAAISALAVNSFSKDYLSSWGRDIFSDRLIFLRSLPISDLELVANRLLTLLLSLPINATMFFLPPYLLLENLRAELGPAQYLSFVVLWAGYALLYAGFYIYMEFNASGKAYNIAMLPMLVIIVIIGGTIALVFNVSLISNVASLASNYGLLLTAPTLILAVFWLLACCWVTVKRMKKRKFKV